MERPPTPSRLRRTVRFVAGVLLTAAGVAMLVLPGPGLVAIAAGLGLALAQLPRGRRLIARVRLWVRDRTDRDRVHAIEARLPDEIVPADDTTEIRRVAGDPSD